MTKVLVQHISLLSSKSQFCRTDLRSSLSNSATRSRLSAPVVVRAQHSTITRREASVITGLLLPLITVSPAHALFGIGGSRKEEYQTETSNLLENVKSIVSMEKEDPTRDELTEKVRLQTNQWVAKYRRDNNFAGKPSYSNTYSVVNALQGHFNSFGTEAPLPKKRLERMLKEVTDAERFLSRDYKKAGVDIDAGNELVRRIRRLNPNIGGFNGLVPFGDSYLVAGTDGVGTKLKLAFEMQKHDTIGIDLVAMSVNDILTSGADPMFFLDYYATGKLDVDVAEQVIKGIVQGCDQSDCILLGGETAEMPGFYSSGEYDVAGFAVGSVKKEQLINGKASIQTGDALIGLKSSGLHSNGFSLVRKLSGISLHDKTPWDSEKTLGDVLLEPTIIYVRQIKELMKHIKIKVCFGIAQET
eukprot:g3984.t1